MEDYVLQPVRPDFQLADNARFPAWMTAGSHFVTVPDSNRLCAGFAIAMTRRSSLHAVAWQTNPTVAIRVAVRLKLHPQRTGPRQQLVMRFIVPTGLENSPALLSTSAANYKTTFMILDSLIRFANPVPHFSALAQLAAVVSRYRFLTLEMTRREFIERYAGQMLGTIWIVGHPILLMAIYVFVFGHVFQTRLGGGAEFPLNYTTFILSGLIPWLAFSDLLGKSTTIISSNAGLVKQVVFPVEILPVKASLASVVSPAISMAALLLYSILTQHKWHLTWLLLPVLLVLQMLAMCGIAFLLSALGTFFRDLKDIVAVFCTANLFLIPVIYNPTSIPAVLRWVIFLNPFSYPTWCFHDAVYYGEFRHPYAWVVFILLALGGTATGFRFFRRLQTTFGNVL